MKIVYIVPGFGGTFYCGNCLRDSAFSKSLKEEGHESVTLPLYLPHSIEEFAHQTDVPVFYGAVNIYLKQNFKLFRKMPKWLYTFFNSPAILKYAAKKSSSTRATGLEEMTISMLKGEEGNQNKELDQLIHYLKNHEKPDIVHLSNALLLGLAAQIKKELYVPVFCSLQDEDIWINDMREDYKPKLWQLMSEKAKDIDSFIAVSDFFAGVMQKNMKIEKHKINVVHIGVDPSAYKVFTPQTDIPTIGYLSRMNEENGFEILIDAFILLKKKSAFAHARLKLTGGKTGDDDKFINKQIKKLEKANFMADVEFFDDFRTSNLEAFFNSVTVLSVPVLNGEAFGLYLLEALASGIPLVQPDIGAFPEIIKETGGGVVYTPNNAKTLADKLAETLADRDKLMEMSKNGREAIVKNFNTKASAKKLVEIYQEILGVQNL